MKNLLKKFPLFVRLYSFLNKSLTPKSWIFTKNRKDIYNSTVLEIGGPSLIFEDDNLIPVYKIAIRVDNCNFAQNNFWSSIDEGDNFEYNKNKSKGYHYIQDATELNLIQNNKYDVLCSSHVIEHIANPLKALNEWMRVLKPGGTIILIAPNKKFTYDRNRPVTELSHIIKDYQNDISEKDDTHFEEIICLHDLSIDSTVLNFEEHKRRTLNNSEERIVHHHVFDSNLLKSLLEYSGFILVDIEERKPFHLIAFAKRPK